MAWTNEEIAALVEPDRAHRKAYTDEDLFELEMERMPSKTTLILSGNELDEKAMSIIKEFNEKRKYNIVY